MNGFFREKVVTPRTSDEIGHVTSTVILAFLIILVTRVSIAWIGITSVREALLLGFGWTITTLTFEFIAGHYLFGNPWAKLMADYNLAKGRVWIFIPFITLLCPSVLFLLISA